jgi:aminopeptidase N
VPALFIAGWSTTQVWPRKQDRMTLEAGVPRALADDRVGRIRDLAYDITLDIPADPGTAVRGRLIARFTLTDASAPVTFDFAQPAEQLLAIGTQTGALAIDVTGRTRDAALVENGHVLIPSSALVRGSNEVTFDFTTVGTALNRAADFAYSLFVPARAAETFPCFDQPSLKARWTLTLHVPASWQAVSNGPELARTSAAGKTAYRFATTEPLPPYLFSFAAGAFQVVEGERDGRHFRVLHRETDAARLSRNLGAIFDQHAQALTWLAAYTGIPYRFGKFDIVLIPSFQFTGMEHPGAVYYNASALLLDEAATRNQELVRANVIAHETAHMWFGNLVTMTWFDDVWMKEVFANFYAARIVNPSFPDINHDLRFLLQHYPQAYDVDRTEGTNPIRQSLDNLAEAGSLYGAIIYQKAPIVMRQLERLVGADVFRDAIGEYLRSFEFGHASWSDLIAIIDRRSTVDLATWNRAWVTEAGRPVVTTEVETAKGVVTRLTVRQRDRDGRSIVWPQVLTLILGSGNAQREIAVSLKGPATEVPQAIGIAAPDLILPIGDGLGYGLFELDKGTTTYLLQSLHAIEDPLTRGASLVALWEWMLDGGVRPNELVDELIRALPLERDELLVQHMLDLSRTIFWRFTPPSARPGLARRLEPVLFDGLDRAGTTSARTAWFNALRNTALSADAVAWLEAVWRRDRRIPGLPLAETDEAELALDLAVRDVPRAREILTAQLGRMMNPDRKDRFAFIMPAVSPDDAERAQFFDGLRRIERRRREAWVVDAMRYLHHPLRASTSARHVIPALETVEEIRRTGDIFFPKRWSDAVLSGYQSREMAEQVHATIDARGPEYPARLRWVLLSAADPLFRAARLLEP